MNMMVSRRAMLGGLAVAGGWAATARPALALVDSGPAFPATRAFLSGFVERKELAGAVAAIGRGAEAPQFVAAGSLALGGPVAVDPDSLWRVYSMTKPITGMAAMMLVDRGKLRLDQPIADLLPAYAKMQVQVTPDGSLTDVRPAKTQITVRHLLTHTAGLGYSIVQKGPLLEAYRANGILPGKVTRLPLPGIDNSPIAPSLAEFADRLAKLPLVYEPGTRWSYSVSLDLLGRVIEVASGKAFDTFLAEEMFGPLGMTSSWFQVPASEVGRLTTNYAPFGGALVPIDPAASSIYLDKPEFAFGGAGLVSSARDYDRFLMMLAGKGAIGGTRLMSEATAMLAMSNLLDDSVDRTGTFVAGKGFGAGGAVSVPGNPEGPGNYGWGGAAGTVAFVNPFKGIRGAGYAQYMPPDSLEFQRGIGLKIVQDLGAA
jgi:CubicO group peptidase (beta-lactamase class C family)